MGRRINICPAGGWTSVVGANCPSPPLLGGEPHAHAPSMPSWIIKGSAVVLIGDGRHGDGRDNIARLCLLASVRGNGVFSEKVAVRGSSRVGHAFASLGLAGTGSLVLTRRR
jgi:hypothetical protein